MLLRIYDLWFGRLDVGVGVSRIIKSIPITRRVTMGEAPRAIQLSGRILIKSPLYVLLNHAVDVCRGIGIGVVSVELGGGVGGVC